MLSTIKMVALAIDVASTPLEELIDDLKSSIKTWEKDKSDDKRLHMMLDAMRLTMKEKVGDNPLSAAEDVFGTITGMKQGEDFEVITKVKKKKVIVPMSPHGDA